MCTRPMYMFDNGLRSDGKRAPPFLWPVARRMTCPRDVYVEHPAIISCGQCLECKLAKRREWVHRSVAEMQRHDAALFVTLTYDNDCVPHALSVDQATGEVLDNLSLRYADVQLFLKRLRKNLGVHFRYLACSEYGGQTFRPHYHAVLFGLSMDMFGDATVWYTGRSSRSHKLYHSRMFDDIWANGRCLIAPAERDCAGYVAGYTIKKLYGDDAELYGNLGLEVPGIRMSRMPGLGKDWYLDHLDQLYTQREIYVADGDSQHVIRPTHYSHKLLEAVDPERYYVEMQRIYREIELRGFDEVPDEDQQRREMHLDRVNKVCGSRSKI